MAIKIIHTGDVHFDSALSGFADGTKAKIRREEMKNTFSKIIEYGKNADMLLISGDLFDGKNVGCSTLEFLRNEFSKVKDVKVFISAGNHDPRTFDSVYETFDFGENVHVFATEPECIETDEADIYGVSFKASNDYRTLLPEIKIKNPDKINILVMHGNLSGEDYNPVKPQDIENSGFDYIALGHIHIHSGLLRCGKTFYAYPGCPEGRGLDETGEKGVLAVTLSKGFAESTFIPTCERMYIDEKIDVSGAESIDDILEKINEIYLGDKHIYRIKLIGETDVLIDTEVLQNRVEGFSVAVIDNTTPKIDLESLKSEFTLKGLFAKYAFSEKDLIDDEIFYDALKKGLSFIEKEERNENR